MVFESLLLWAQHFITEAGYFAIFAASAVITSTIFIGIIGGTYAIILFAVGLGFNPLFVGLSAGLGSAIGELTGYMIGLGSEVSIEKYEKKIPRMIKKMMKLFKNIGFWVVFVAALLPVPFDVIGILSGMSRYNLKKFLIATILGRIIRSVAFAYVGYSLFPFVEHLFD